LTLSGHVHFAHGSQFGPTLANLTRGLALGSLTSRKLVEQCLAQIARLDGEGSATYVHVDAEQARQVADAVDAKRRAGVNVQPLAGIPVSIKDVFDVQGQVTRAGSRALSGSPPANADAVAVARWRRSGLVLLGRTNMTEFAYSGLGLNPWFGTPRNPWQRVEGRVPGGSSSGAAISVSDAMAHGALGTDTGGSCRIPAAFTGLVGYKPSRDTALMKGAIPLAPSLDTAGVLGRSVACCEALVQAMGQKVVGPIKLASAPVLGVPQTLVLDALDAEVAAAFERTLSTLSSRGFRLLELPLHAFARVPELNSRGGFPAAQSYHWHRARLPERRTLYDPHVLRRIERGGLQSAADYLDLLAGRNALIGEVECVMDRCHALVLPTVPIVPPRIDALMDDDEHQRANALSLRNTGLVNLFDGCAISLPIHRAGDAPVGLMLGCLAGGDAQLLTVATMIERALGYCPRSDAGRHHAGSFVGST
jgi:aspartyl-tRNA(Asn)/glutamyl-tRNA(Gln) amidotransferase subunit A